MGSNLCFAGYAEKITLWRVGFRGLAQICVHLWFWLWLGSNLKFAATLFRDRTTFMGVDHGSLVLARERVVQYLDEIVDVIRLGDEAAEAVLAKIGRHRIVRVAARDYR